MDSSITIYYFAVSLCVYVCINSLLIYSPHLSAIPVDIGSKEVFLNICLSTPAGYNIFENSFSVVGSRGEV